MWWVESWVCNGVTPNANWTCFVLNHLVLVFLLLPSSPSRCTMRMLVQILHGSRTILIRHYLLLKNLRQCLYLLLLTNKNSMIIWYKDALNDTEVENVNSTKKNESRCLWGSQRFVSKIVFFLLRQDHYLWCSLLFFLFLLLILWFIRVW